MLDSFEIFQKVGIHPIPFLSVEKQLLILGEGSARRESK